MDLKGRPPYTTRTPHTTTFPLCTWSRAGPHWAPRASRTTAISRLFSDFGIDYSHLDRRIEIAGDRRLLVQIHAARYLLRGGAQSAGEDQRSGQRSKIRNRANDQRRTHCMLSLKVVLSHSGVKSRLSTSFGCSCLRSGFGGGMETGG